MFDRTIESKKVGGFYEKEVDAAVGGKSPGFELGCLGSSHHIVQPC
jgi:hypothetical protein